MCDTQWKSIIIRALHNCRFKEDEFPATEQKMKKSDESKHGDSNNRKMIPILVKKDSQNESEGNQID